MNNFRDLVKPSNEPWEWTPTLRVEFKLAKEEIIRRVKDGVKYYDVNKLTCVSTDWSKVGTGMLVTQKHCDCKLENTPRCCKDGFKIIFAGSKRCSGAESCYAPIEGEALGVVWSLEKARMFTLGCPGLLVTVDHQPLISILGEKCLADIPNPRLYRFKERCMRFRFKIQYLPGGKNDTEVGTAITACHIASVEEVYVGRCKEDNMAVTWEEIAILEGFPEKLEECIPLIQPFHKNRINLSIVVEDKLEVVVYYDSDLRSRMLIPSHSGIELNTSSTLTTGGTSPG